AMRHEDAERGRRVEIDVVDADRVLRDDAKLRKRLEDLAIDEAAAERRADERRGIRRGGEQSRTIEIELLGDDRAARVGGPAMRLAALVDGPVDQDLRAAVRSHLVRSTVLVAQGRRAKPHAPPFATS